MITAIKQRLRNSEQAMAIARIAVAAALLGALAMFMVMQAMPPSQSDIVTVGYVDGAQSAGGAGYQVIRLESQFLSDEAIRGLQAEIETLQSEVTNCVQSENCN